MYEGIVLFLFPTKPMFGIFTEAILRNIQNMFLEVLNTVILHNFRSIVAPLAKVSCQSKLSL